MGRRIKLPVNQMAYADARAEFYQRHPELVNAGLRINVPAAHLRYKALRTEWLNLYEKYGGETHKGTEHQGKYPDTLNEPVAFDNPILAIHILDGNNHTYLQAGHNAIQHVNLPVDMKWVDGNHVRNIDRLSRRLRVKVEFTKPGKERFRIQLVAHRDNTEYTPTEQAARASFQYQRAPMPGATDDYNKLHGNEYRGKTGANGTKVTDRVFEVTPAVGDRYKFIAWDTSGNEVHSVEFTTKRTVYYMTLRTHNAAHAVTTPALRAGVEPVYSNLHTQMIYLGEEQLAQAAGEYYPISTPFDFLNQVNLTSRNPCVNFPTKTYTEFSPFLLRVVLGDHLANSYKAINDDWQGDRRLLPVGPVPVGPGSPRVVVPVQMQQPPANDPHADMRKALWEGLGPVAVATTPTMPGSNWFVSGELTLHNQTTIAIPLANCTPEEIDPVNRPDFYGQVRVQVDNLTPNQTTGTIRLSVIVVGRCVNGEANKPEAPGAMLQASRHNFAIIPAAKQIAAIIHEMGHSLGMVAAPTYKHSGVDSPPYYYFFTGNHCYNGVPPQAQAADYHSDPNLQNSANCVMFGLVPPIPNMDFCDDCEAALKKLDLSDGFV